MESICIHTVDLLGSNINSVKLQVTYVNEHGNEVSVFVFMRTNNVGMYAHTHPHPLHVRVLCMCGLCMCVCVCVCRFDVYFADWWS